MEIKQLEIENFRGIEKLSLDFTKPTTVFKGDNGAGKSAILDCLAILLSRFYRSFWDTYSRGHFDNLDITNGKKEACLGITVSLNEYDLEWRVSIIKQKSGPIPHSKLGQNGYYTSLLDRIYRGHAYGSSRGCR